MSATSRPVGCSSRSGIFPKRTRRRQVKLDDEGYIKVDGGLPHQPARGVRGWGRGGPHLPPGDHRGRHGCAAALDAERFLSALRHREGPAEPTDA